MKIGFDSSKYAIIESGGSITLQVHCMQNKKFTCQVDYKTVEGTAIENKDYIG